MTLAFSVDRIAALERDLATERTRERERAESVLREALPLLKHVAEFAFDVTKRDTARELHAKGQESIKPTTGG